jgi:hypothetical protein
MRAAMAALVAGVWGRRVEPERVSCLAIMVRSETLALAAVKGRDLNDVAAARRGM